MTTFTLKQPSILPGFGLTLGYTLFYMSLIALIPLSALVLRTATMSWDTFWAQVGDPRVVASLQVTFKTALIAAIVNAVFGTIVAWVLVRYSFPGKGLFDAFVDLPFALPTAVSGIALTAIYAPTGWLGQYFAPLGIKLAYSQTGIVLAMIFIGLPYVVRTLQPAIEELDGETEEAAASLGASRWQTFWRVIFPALLPSLLTGFALSFARGLGEYGSVIFIAGNKRFESEIASKLIFEKLDQNNYDGATAIAVVMLAGSFVILLGINLLQWYVGQYGKKAA